MALALVAGLVAGIVIGPPGSSPTTTSPRPRPPEGGSNLLVTPDGVVWTFDTQNGWGAVLRSADGGRRWQVTLPSRASLGLLAAYFLGPKRAWAASQTAIYRTVDGGRHWQRSELPGAPPPDSVPAMDYFVLSFANRSDGWAIGLNDVQPSLQAQWWHTANGGRTWQQLPDADLPVAGVRLAATGRSSCPEFSPPHLLFVSARRGWLTPGACGAGPAHPVVWRTEDGGRRWTARRLPVPSGSWAVIDAGGVDIGRPSLETAGAGTELLVPVASGTNQLLIERSSNQGRTWRTVSRIRVGVPATQSTPADWFDPVSATRWVITGPGGIIETADAGGTWTHLRTQASVTSQTIEFTSLRNGWAQGGETVAALHTTDAGRNWTSVTAPDASPALAADGSTAISAISVLGANHIVAAGGRGIELSVDGGRTWATTAVSFPVMQLQFVNDQVGFAVGDDVAVGSGELLRTTDGGASWTRLLEPTEGAVTSAQFWSADAGVAVGPYTTLLLTTDGGNTWTPVPTPATTAQTPMDGSPGWAATGGGGLCFDQRAGWAVGSRDGHQQLFVTTDDGQQWRASLAAPSLPANPGEALAIEACSGQTAWIEVARQVAPSESLGTPVALTVLRTANLGRSWVAVLQQGPWSGVTPQTGSAQPVPNPFGYSAGPGPFALAGPGVAWRTLENEDLGGVQFASTGDNGLHWTVSSFPPPQNGSIPAATTDQLPVDSPILSLGARNADDAWVLLGGSKITGSSYLYATGDGGRGWQQVAAFSWSH